jgi:hypothetical protein
MKALRKEDMLDIVLWITLLALLPTKGMLFPFKVLDKGLSYFRRIPFMLLLAFCGGHCGRRL